MYFDNAATTVVKRTQGAEAMFKVISSQKYGNPSRGSHEYAINSLSVVNKCRQNIRRCVMWLQIQNKPIVILSD